MVSVLNKRITLDDLILEMMRRRSCLLQIEELEEIVSRLEIDGLLMQQHINFCHQSYTRNLLCRTSCFEMLVLCWQPGQCSTIHDHGGALNVTRVYTGTLTSRLFEVSDTIKSGCHLVRLKSEEKIGKNKITAVDRHDIHQLANTSSEKLVTLHIYATPLKNITVYCPQSGQSEPVRLRYSLEEDFA